MNLGPPHEQFLIDDRVDPLKDFIDMTASSELLSRSSRPPASTESGARTVRVHVAGYRTGFPVLDDRRL
jgi:hypothetical protein